MLSPAPETFKTMMDSQALPRLSGFSILQASGAEAAAFLQAQAMNDVLALALGQWQWNGWLNPKGRVIALFALLRESADAFLLVLPDYPAADLLPQLQRFVFRAKVRMQARDDLACAGGLAPSSTAAAVDHALGDEASGWKLDLGGAGGPRQLWLLPGASARIGDSSTAFDQDWLALDIAHGFPRLGESQHEAWTPQMLGLDRLNAYSLKKGCYPGQEIVARTHYLGQAKRHMVRVGGKGLQVGLELQDGTERAAGTIVSARADGGEALAVMGATASSLRLAGGTQATILPFSEGLARPL